jgi:hypothetical protein
LLKEVQNEAEEIALTPVVVPMESSLVINHHPAISISFGGKWISTISVTVVISVCRGLKVGVYAG